MPEKMNPIEKKAVISLASVMSLRMLGLFIVLPVFSIYAQQLHGATPTLIGLSLGIYGLTQALLQIPFGALSDRYGRKPLIFIGLIFFAIGSCIAGLTQSITLMIIGRALQGAGAIGSTTLAMLADLTRETHRTRSMAIVGMSIGFSFSLAMLLGPVLIKWMPVNYLFFLALLFSLLAIFILYRLPSAKKHVWQRDTQPELNSFLNLIFNSELLKLNIGIFILHAIFTASFVVIPISLAHFLQFSAHDQWQIYLPILLFAFIITLQFIRSAEKNHKVKHFFLLSIIFIGLGELSLWIAPQNLFVSTIGLSLFFIGFSTLEAFLPSLISRIAPVGKKGSALGLYSSAQFLGIFVGGILGGLLFGRYGFPGVYVLCLILSSFWFILASLMQLPAVLRHQAMAFEQ